ncbi:amidase [Nocardioides sp. HM23]|jgi:Asp-tRNA(Asn)/Glu-tRNA(Gln) amidotransferase A subunit family amidase|uniref:amidase n=1 Tax=Nocardioides bizhenqiangii TaxID=3095076 RepID=UPI002ACA88A6|nr:amidase [Nocardioides sp. HM23]MDZ5621092.1 amidase [Nocardioides sp. HM23]
MTDELFWKTAAELGDLYRAREVSPVEVVDAVLDRMAHVQPVLNIMVTETADQARADAQEAERRFKSGEELPLLFGVPMTVKDLAETKGVRTTYGCVAFADHVPDHDAVGWERLKAQGAILLGKTTTPEFGLLGVTESKLTGSTSTPWKPGYNAGGSSGGAAAAVVAGVGPIAWGSDGGGSIRVPSSLCGAVGIKPSIGRIPTIDCDDADSTDGPIARTVLDAAMVLEVTNGHDPRDRFSVPKDTRSYIGAATAPGDLTGVRVAACYHLGQKVLDPNVRRLFGEALNDMRAAGATVEEVDIDLPDAMTFFDHINGHAYQQMVEEMDTWGIEIWPMIRELARSADGVTARQVHDANHRVKTAIYNAFRTAMNGADVMVTPTTPVVAFPHGGAGGPAGVVDGFDVPALGNLAHMTTEPPSHAGLPAISVPGGFTPEGLPIGVQFIGGLWADADLISVAARYQRATTWHTRHPGL